MPHRPSPLAERLLRPLLPLVYLLAALWCIEAVNTLLGHALNRFGILPRTLSGLGGIPLAPFLHAGFAHLAANTVPLAVLGGLVASGGRGQLARTSTAGALIGGLGIWLLGRPSYHIGSSILVFGYFGFLLADAFYRRTFRAVALAALTLALYAGLVLGVLPQSGRISWEGHLFGLIGGAVAARGGRRRRKRR